MVVLRKKESFVFRKQNYATTKENYLQKNISKNHQILVIFLEVFTRAFFRSVIKLSKERD